MYCKLWITVFVLKYNANIADAEDGVKLHFPGVVGVPVKHADVIRPLLLDALQDTAHRNGDAVVDFVLNGYPPPEPRSSLSKGVLDVRTFNQIAKNLTKQAELERFEEDFAEAESRINKTLMKVLKKSGRRWANDRELETELVSRHNGWKHEPSIAIKALDLMKQTVYQTRFYLKRTAPFRKVYRDDDIFKLGSLFGSLMINKNKIEALYWTIRKFDPRYVKSHFYIITYEKILATHTDIHFGMKMIIDTYIKVKKSMEDHVEEYENLEKEAQKQQGEEGEQNEATTENQEFADNGDSPAEDAGVGSEGGFKPRDPKPGPQGFGGSIFD